MQYRPYSRQPGIISREEKKKSKNSVYFVTFVTFYLFEVLDERSFTVLKK